MSLDGSEEDVRLQNRGPEVDAMPSTFRRVSQMHHASQLRRTSR